MLMVTHHHRMSGRVRVRSPHRGRVLRLVHLEQARHPQDGHQDHGDDAQDGKEKGDDENPCWVGLLLRFCLKKPKCYDHAGAGQDPCLKNLLSSCGRILRAVY